MNSIPRQLATFAAVLAALYTVGFIAGQFIDAGDEMTHDSEKTSKSGMAVAENGLRLQTAAFTHEVH